MGGAIFVLHSYLAIYIIHLDGNNQILEISEFDVARYVFRHLRVKMIF